MDAWTISGLVLLTAAALASVHALFADRPGGRRRCRACWYDMKGTPGLTCPECGRVHRRDRDLLRTRRRWGRALAATGLGVLLSQACFAAPRVAARGWPGALPTAALMLGAGWLPAPPEGASVPAPWASPAPPTMPEVLGAELGERLESPTTWRWQKALFQRACATLAIPGVPGADPPDDAASLRWLIVSRDRGMSSLWAYRPYLDALTPRLISTRTKWVSFRPYVFRFAGRWLAAFPRGRLEYEVCEHGNLIAASRYAEGVEVGRLAPGVHDLDVTIRLREDGASELVEAGWSKVQRVRVEIFPTLDGLHLRRSDEETAAVIADGVVLDAVEEGSVVLRLKFRGDAWRRPGDAPGGLAGPPLNVSISITGPSPEVRWKFPVSRWGGPGFTTEGARIALDGGWTTTMRTGLSVEQFERQTLRIDVVGDPDEVLFREEKASFWEGSLRFSAVPRLGPMPLVQSPVAEAPR